MPDNVITTVVPHSYTEMTKLLEYCKTFNCVQQQSKLSTQKKFIKLTVVSLLTSQQVTQKMLKPTVYNTNVVDNLNFSSSASITFTNCTCFQGRKPAKFTNTSSPHLSKIHLLSI